MSAAALWISEAADEFGRRVRIAIVSLEIVALIRRAFVSKGLDMRIHRLSTLELTVGPDFSPAAAFADVLGRMSAVRKAAFQQPLPATAATGPDPTESL